MAEVVQVVEDRVCGRKGVDSEERSREDPVGGGAVPGFQNAGFERVTRVVMDMMAG